MRTLVCAKNVKGRDGSQPFAQSQRVGEATKGLLALLLFEPISVYLNKVFPLLWSRGLLKDRLDWTYRFTGPAVDAFFRIDIELLFFLELFGLVLGWMDTIDRTNIDTCVSFTSMQGSAMI